MARIKKVMPIGTRKAKRQVQRAKVRTRGARLIA